MSCNDKHHYDSNCVCDVLKFIHELQDAVSDTCPTGCDTPFLGANCNAPLANTRPFLLYDKKGELFIPASCLTFPADVPFPVPSPFFRVESVDDCCAVLRVLTFDFSSVLGDTITESWNGLVEATKGSNLVDILARFLVCIYTNGIEIDDGHKKLCHPPLIATTTCITVDLNCFCAVQCLRDCHVTSM